MRKLMLHIVILYTVVFCQYYQMSSRYTTTDEYYGDLLYLKYPSQVVSTKVKYPGLTRDTISTISTGFLSHPIDGYYSYTKRFPSLVDNHSVILPSDLYGWAELNTKAGKFGGWIGDMNAYDRKASYSEYTHSSQSGFGRCALWYIPTNNTLMKGLSTEINGYLKRDMSKNFDDYNPVKQEASTNGFSFRVMSLWELNEKFLLNSGFSGGYYFDENHSTKTSDYDYSPPGNRTNLSVSEKTWSNHYNGFSIGLVNHQCKSILATLILSTTTDKNSFSDYYYYTWNNYYGDITGILELADSREFTYQKHSLHTGVNVTGSFLRPAVGFSDMTYSGIPNNLKKETYTIRGILKIPAVVNINLFNSSIYAVFRIAPQFLIDYFRDSDTTEHYTNFTIDEVALGLQGSIGKNIEFSLIPSINSTIFMTGLELRYKF